MNIDYEKACIHIFYMNKKVYFTNNKSYIPSLSLFFILIKPICSYLSFA